MPHRENSLSPFVLADAVMKAHVSGSSICGTRDLKKKSHSKFTLLATTTIMERRRRYNERRVFDIMFLVHVKRMPPPPQTVNHVFPFRSSRLLSRESYFGLQWSITKNLGKFFCRREKFLISTRRRAEAISNGRFSRFHRSRREPRERGIILFHALNSCKVNTVFDRVDEFKIVSRLTDNDHYSS